MTPADRGVVVRVVAVSAVALAAWGCGGDGPVAIPPGVAGDSLGEQVYAFRCATCHGDAGEGAVGPRVDQPEMWDRLGDDGVRAVIDDGAGNMAGYEGLIPDAEIDAVVEFLRTLDD